MVLPSDGNKQNPSYTLASTKTERFRSQLQLSSHESVNKNAKYTSGFITQALSRQKFIQLAEPGVGGDKAGSTAAEPPATVVIHISLTIAACLSYSLPKFHIPDIVNYGGKNSEFYPNDATGAFFFSFTCQRRTGYKS